MANLDGAAVAVAGLLTINAVQMFHQSAPKLSDIRAADPGDRGMMADLRLAEIETAAVLVLSGVSISAMTGNAYPAWISVLTAVTLVGVYEWARVSWA